MTEKMPSQSNPENSESKRYLIPISSDEYAYAVINRDKQAIHPHKQKSGPPAMMTSFEATYETTNSNGEVVVETEMIPEHLLRDEKQRDLQQQYLDSVNKNKGEQNE